MDGIMNRYPKPSPLTPVLFWRARAVYFSGESSNEIGKIVHFGVIGSLPDTLL